MTAPAAVSQGNTGRSILAVVTAFVVVFILSLGTDQVLHVLKVYPPWGQPMWDNKLNALALSYRLAYDVAGGWIAARLAPRNPMKHAIIVGSIGTALSILGAVGAIMMKTRPTWYPVALAVTALPTAWVGGRLYKPRA
ncbi:MAG TPA: hypothetical protein VF483_10235 [Gemmatimonadaceae bacterium]